MTNDSLSQGGLLTDFQSDATTVTDIRPFAEAERRSNLVEYGVSPFWRGMVRILSNLPIIGNTNVVKQAAADITFSDTTRAERFEAFVGALRSQYGAEITDKVVAITALSPTNYLSLSKMREARDVAAMRQGVTHNQRFQNRVEVKVWNWENMNRVGHVSLLLRHPIANHGRTVLKGDKAETYASWWPGNELPTSTDNSLVDNVVDKIVHRLAFTGTALGRTSDYANDVYAEMSERTREGLEEGRLQPLPGQVPMNYIDDSTNLPTTTWGMEPNASIAMPMAGYNEKPYVDAAGKEENYMEFTWTPFGLDGGAIKTYWETEIKGNKSAQFKIFSTDWNCSGVSARLLKAGGAEAFLPVPETTLLMDPNTMRRYATDLMTEVTALNAKSEAIDAMFSKLFVLEMEADENGAPPTFSVRFKRVQDAIALLPPATKATMQTLSDAVAACDPVAHDHAGMMRQLKGLVNGLHPHIKGPFGTHINLVLVSACHLLNAIRVEAFADKTHNGHNAVGSEQADVE
ncbi:hypothetical protein WM40_18255 [Robbsia andropogonis]|uniref:Uncharacterized protein n=2 Tax=Robbsia andropogonis TaxID=28092 RepID=A0A0F5JY90_9BURK|nr:hypothetical protein [Robbsia andropogonis]KKB62252.1 hypothetical protein WM40_18255 [Robbsia andropogonis]